MSLSRMSTSGQRSSVDRKSTRLNSSHLVMSYAVFCLKKNKRQLPHPDQAHLTTPSSLPRTAPKALIFAVQLLVLSLILVIIAWIVGPGELMSAVRLLDMSVLVLALVLTVGFVLGRAAKWLLLARTAVPSLSYRDSVLSLLGGMGLGMITPGRAA